MKRNTKIFITAVAEVLMFSAVILLLEVNRIVNGKLYYYGLIFSYEWSFEYEIFFGLTMIIIVILAFLIPMTVMTQLEDE
jgi:hypothetical protein